MISSAIAKMLEPFAQLANRNALSDNYKCIEIQPKLIRGCSAYGILEADASILFTKGGKKPITDTIYLNTTTFIAVIKSLPSDQEVTFQLEGGKLSWECAGLIKGSLAIMAPVEIPVLEMPAENDDYGEVDEDFCDALELGGISCSSQGMASAGIYGVLIDNRENLSVLSSDNITVAACLFGDQVEWFAKQFVLSPEAASLLSNLIKRATSDPELAIQEKALYFRNKVYRLMLRPIPPLKHDLQEIITAYSEAQVVVPLPKVVIESFIKRAQALSESKEGTYVDLSIQNKQLSLSFVEDTAMTHEYHLLQNDDLQDLAPISLNASRVARVLSRVTDIVLDHMERGVIVLKGADFSYMISGRKE